MDNYVEVHERITAFYEKYPEGALTCKEWSLVDTTAGTFLVYIAQAFRTADDQCPAEGAAWEPVPGKTNFTRDSELMNAETSAWGRAIAALGFEVKRGIASANEVRARSGSDNGSDDRPASDKQRGYVNSLLGQSGITDPVEKAAIVDAICGGDKLTSSGASQIIKACKAGKVETLRQVAGLDSDVENAPVDEEGIDPESAPDDESIPF